MSGNRLRALVVLLTLATVVGGILVQHARADGGRPPQPCAPPCLVP